MELSMKIQVEKVIKEIEVLTEVLSVESFNKKYPAWIFNSLTTVELKLKETLKNIEELNKSTIGA
jgi:hypothetical protein